MATSNFQNVVGVIDRSAFGLTRDELLAVLRAENVAAERHFNPPAHSVSLGVALGPGQLDHTEAAARSTFQLPIGARLTADAIEQICDIVREAHVHSEALKSLLAALTVT